MWLHCEGDCRYDPECFASQLGSRMFLNRFNQPTLETASDAREVKRPDNNHCKHLFRLATRVKIKAIDGANNSRLMRTFAKAAAKWSPDNEPHAD